MVRRYVAAVLCVVMVSSTVVLSAPEALKLTKGRVAISHDGNAYDQDDHYAGAMDWAVLSAFGCQKRLVHYHHSVFQSNNDPGYHTEMIKSAQGWKYFPGFDSSMVFDAWNNMDKTAAHFKVQADKSSADDKIYFALAGPMHVPYLCITATAKDKRKFIHCVSHSGANETMKSGVSGGKVWADIKAAYSVDGVICEDIVDQNANLGGIGHTKWSWLTTGMTVKEGIPLTAWAWVYSRDTKNNGDCSDNGMVWYILTGNLNGRCSPNYEERFKSPLPMEGGTTGISPSAVGFSTQPFAVSFTQNNKVLDVTARGMKGTGSVGIYNLLSRQVGKAPLLNGQARISLNSRGTTGNYIMTVESQGQKVSKQILVK